MMHGGGKSDEAIVAGKPANKAERSATEPVERRAEAKGNASQQSTPRTQCRIGVSQALERIRQAAKASPIWPNKALPAVTHPEVKSRMRESSATYGSCAGSAQQ